MIEGVAGVIIWTEDLDRLFAFYRHTLELIPYSIRPNFIAFRWGEMRLSLGKHAKVRGPSCDPYRIMINLAVDECGIDLLSLSLPACCPKGRPDRCGIDVGYVARSWGYDATCLELNAPGKLDPSCPALSVPLPDGRLAELKGCRTPALRCGYDVRVEGAAELGCTEPPARLPR